MPPLTTAQSQANTRPILSRLTQDWRPDPKKFVWPLLFPLALAEQLMGKWIKHDKSAFTVPDIQRSKGGTIRRIRRAFTDENVELVRRTLAGEIDEDDMKQARRIPGRPIRLEMREARLTIAQINLIIEHEAARVAMLDASFPAAHRVALAGNAMWDNDAAKPKVAVSDQGERVYDACGYEPNTLALGYSVTRKLLLREDVLKEFYGDNPRISLRQRQTEVANDVEMDEKLRKLASYFNVERVGNATAQYVNDPDDDSFARVWGKVAILAYVEREMPMEDIVEESMTWGAMLRWRDMDSAALDGDASSADYPRVLDPWFDRNNTCHVYPVQSYDTPRVLAPQAGARWTNVVT